MINLCELNSKTDLFDYNCGGFALNEPDWYCPYSYDEGQDIPTMIEECVTDILKDFPELSKVSHYSNVPDKFDVIGFRLCVADIEMHDDYDNKGNAIVIDMSKPGRMIEEVRDLHFILRSEGIWYHKPGSKQVEIIDFDVDEEWPHNEWNYNTDTVWFMRDHVDIRAEDMPLLIAGEHEEEAE
jgi:hypothetical protein